ncbi:MAG: sigma-70 family RNA polymerase sigma factor [Planctomycetes bacterium]|nr:sigma-70 family RNA polymerase sigma factor [Planctomycetota bacterium]
MALTDSHRELLNRCIAGEPGGWKDLVDRFLRLFVHVVHHTAHARSVRLTPEDVDDFCAEVFVTLLDHDYAVLRNFRGECSLSTYLTVIARRVIVREMARRRAAEAMGHVLAHPSPPLPGDTDPRDIQRVDDTDEVQKMLAGLPDVEAKIVRQYHLEGRSYREISAGLGVPENSIGPALSRARAKLRGSEVKL